MCYLRFNLLSEGGEVVVLVADVIGEGGSISAATNGNGRIGISVHLSTWLQHLRGDEVGRARLPGNFRSNLRFEA